MSVRPLKLVLVVSAIFSLGCFCGDVSGTMSGGNASDAAKKLAEYKAGEEGVPAGAFGVGEDVTVGDFSYRFETPLIVDVEADIAYIQNVDERSAFAKIDNKGLVLPYSLRNDSPVAADAPHSIAIVTGGGEIVYGMPYNEGIWAEAHGRKGSRDVGKLAPGQWTETVRVYPVAPDAAVGAMAYLAQVTSHYEDKNGDGKKETKVRVLHEHAVADLPAATPGDAIVGQGRTRKGTGSSRDASGRRTRPTKR